MYVCMYIYIYIFVSSHSRRKLSKVNKKVARLKKKCAVSRLGVVLHTLLQDRPGFMASIYYINSINNSNITWVYRILTDIY